MLIEEEECISLVEVEEEGSADSLRAWFFLRPSISSGRSKVEESERSRRSWLMISLRSLDSKKE